MRATVLSLYSFSTLTSSAPLKFTKPESTLLPACTAKGFDSPVRAAVSSVEEPETTSPSRAIRSPALTSMISPARTSSAFTTSLFPSRFTVALSGRMSIREVIDSREESTALSSKNSPIWNKIITATASEYSPIKIAPTVAMPIKNSSPKTRPFTSDFTAPFKTVKPERRYEAQ